jgi:hypothetical protein
MGVAYFSLQGANEKVQKIRRVTERMCQLVEELDFLDNTKIELETDSTESLMAEGCIVRDLQSMEIDFYSRLGERSILLCWKRGEEKIQSWHETFENQTKRKPAIMLEKNYFEQLKKLR